jgi:cysteinyl-tRNA synthetase
MILDTKDESILNTFKFAVLQKIAIEYYTTIEQSLEDQFSLNLSTKYAARFTVNAKTRRKIEKEMAEETKKFKARSKAYRDKNFKMYEMLEGFRYNEQEAVEHCIDEIYVFVDDLIQKNISFKE